MDFTVLTEHFVLVVMVACLVVGYVIKHATSAVYGAVMGLSSTGLHQAFTRFVENKETDKG